jgi:asparagine N-glycosylation enzyme membrane subunit Stt3
MFKDFFDLNSPLFWAIIERFVINLVFLFLLIRVVYYRYSNKPMFVFSYFLMGIVIFILGSMLPIVFSSAVAQLGMAIGLFAIFTILRFRTRNLNIKDMAYIFTVIAISAVNSLEWSEFPMLGIFIFNLIIILSAFILEMLLVRKTKKTKKTSKEKFSTHPIVYDNMEMLKPQNKEELIKNVAEITGLDVKKVKIKKVDYKNKVAIIDIFY